MTPLDPSKPFNILFLCTGNSARSILAEAIMNKVGQGRFVAHSAGSHPKGEVHPQAIKLLRGLGYATEGFRSKPWDEFAVEGAPDLDFVITVCDNAAGEVCPIWPGQPISSHLGLARSCWCHGFRCRYRSGVRRHLSDVEQPHRHLHKPTDFQT